MITVPIREVHELELSSLCNLACVYCPHPVLQREKANMEWATFEAALDHVRYYVAAGTQGELSLTGIGEAILYPRFSSAVERCRMVIGDRLLVMATNGVALNDEHIRVLKEHRVRVYVSLHRPEVAVPALNRLKAAGVEVGTNHAFIDSAIDWAGQVEWHASAARRQCDYLGKGWAVVRQCGGVDACCQDAHNLYPIGHVGDKPGSWRTHVTPLCEKCHLYVPKHFQQEAA